MQYMNTDHDKIINKQNNFWSKSRKKISRATEKQIQTFN